MALNVYAFTCGWLTLPLGLLLEGEKGSLTVPVPSYLVEHPSGRLVFDTGLHTDTQTDPDRRLGRLAPFHKVGFKPGEEVGTRLQALGVDPGKIDFIVNSHLHFDHCGGNQQLPNATLLLQRLEWDAAHNAEMIERVYYDPHDYDHGHRVRTIDGEHDVFGDGSVVLFPTYGHTPGHQSMRVRIGARDVVMTGDACYLRRTLNEMHRPGAKFDAAQMIDSLKRLRAMRDRGAMIITGHDPEMWETVPQAPSKLQFA
jgi:N-acyl homoserine lactone hydrolase